MKLIPSTLCIALACAAPLLGGQAFAQKMPASQLDQLSGFLGDGTCTGNLMMKAGHPTSARYHSEKAIGDHWVMVRYDEETTSSNSKPYHVAQYFSYDAKAGHFVDVIMDNSGESYGAGTSSGWQGDDITFENTDLAGAGHGVFRDVFTRQGTQVISHTGYARDKSGKWIKTDHEVCKRM
ncbi:MAG TPA: hypothetical protein VFX20_01345 [Steroidobacteraceae bacterium]|nr:hypothetical protein [Steroidobacteraceae bacterium]